MKKKSFITIRKALLTEKAYAMAAEKHTYMFAVDLHSTKDDIKSAIEEIYAVKVETVRTLIQRGKVKKQRSGAGKRPNTKKAYVTVAAGQSLPVYEEI